MEHQGAANMYLANTEPTSRPPSGLENHRGNSSPGPAELLEFQQSAEIAVEGFIRNHSQTQIAPEISPGLELTKPVVIPQRRPGSRERGFVRAYAPDLEPFGIEQQSFLDFIDAVNKAVQASKWLHAIQIAAFGTGFIPNHIALGASAAVQVVAGIVAKTETRWKTNSFMDSMNESFFRPKGLYCLLMSYDPLSISEQSSNDSTLDIKPSEPSTEAGFYAKAKRNLRQPYAGVSHGEQSLPDSVATLVYPDTALQNFDKTNPKKAFSRLNNYFDRRAQARYAAESKGDVLSSTPQSSFSNRFLDPNHPATNGGLLGFVSGGKLTPDFEKQQQAMKDAVLAQEQAVRNMQSAQMDSLTPTLQALGYTPEQQCDYMQQMEAANEAQAEQFRGQMQLVENSHRRINRGILYLMIVRFPTDSEIGEALQQSFASDE